LDLAEDPFLQTEIDAFDIGNAFFPPSAWLPENVRLHLHDVYDPFPERFHGQFDVVHLRLFLTLSKAQIARMLQNALTLLSGSPLLI
jgi:hypothetical protein